MYQMLVILKKDKTIPKLLKTTEKPNISDIKPVTIERPKSCTKLAKSIKQIKIITQRPERIEKPNIDEIQPVTI